MTDSSLIGKERIYISKAEVKHILDYMQRHDSSYVCIEHESKKCHHYEEVDPVTGIPTGKTIWYSNPPRNVHYKHRGSKLGFHNPQAKDLVMRHNRERQRSLRRIASVTM